MKHAMKRRVVGSRAMSRATVTVGLPSVLDAVGISTVVMFFVGIGIQLTTHIGGIYVLMFVGFGTILPHMQVSGEIERRFKQVNRGLPFSIDLMALTMSAGLDFPGALR